MDPEAFDAVLDGTTFEGYRPQLATRVPASLVRADPACDAAFRPGDEPAFRAANPEAEVRCVPEAAHNIRGERVGREPFLAALGRLLDAVDRHRPDPRSIPAPTVGAVVPSRLSDPFGVRERAGEVDVLGFVGVQARVHRIGQRAPLAQVEAHR